MVELYQTVKGRAPFFYKLDPRVKLVAVFSFVALTSTMVSPYFLMIAALCALGLAFFSRLPALLLARRLLWIIPFGGILVLVLPFAVPGVPVLALKAGPFSLFASHEGALRAAVLFLRILTAVTALNILTATTRFRDLMDALRSLRVPAVLVQLVEFTVRYIFVLLDEAQRMRTARRARGFDGGKNLFDRHAFSTIGCFVGTLFLRSLERGERVYNAMLARGYSGEIAAGQELGLPVKDLGWGAGILVFAITLRLFEFGGTVWQISLR
ncbi:MAG: cobalt ECF transporter T component CbiQ [Eubacteriales bacterium]